VISNNWDLPFKQFSAFTLLILGLFGPLMVVLSKLTESQGTGKSVASLIILSLQLGSVIPALDWENLNGVGLMV
jgi:hypothetical protein